MTPGKPSDFARPWRVSPKSAMLCRSVHPGRMVMLPRADMQTCVYIYNYIYTYYIDIPMYCQYMNSILMIHCNI